MKKECLAKDSNRHLQEAGVFDRIRTDRTQFCFFPVLCASLSHLWYSSAQRNNEAMAYYLSYIINNTLKNTPILLVPPRGKRISLLTGFDLLPQTAAAGCSKQKGCRCCLLQPPLAPFRSSTNTKMSSSPLQQCGAFAFLAGLSRRSQNSSGSTQRVISPFCQALFLFAIPISLLLQPFRALSSTKSRLSSAFCSRSFLAASWASAAAVTSARLLCSAAARPFCDLMCDSMVFQTPILVPGTFRLACSMLHTVCDGEKFSVRIQSNAAM